MSNNPLPYRHIQEQTERQLLNIMVDKLCCISENTTANNEYKIAYYQEISSSTGTITVPTGATILLNQLAGGADALVSTIDGVPTGSFPQTSGGVQVDVTSFDSSGNYVLSGTPSSYPVALIYWLKISAADYPNLDIDNIIEENIPLLVDNIYTADGTLTGNRTLNLDVNTLEFTGGSGAQLRLSDADAVNDYADFEVDTDGNLNIEPSGDLIKSSKGIQVINSTNAFNYLEFGTSTSNSFAFKDAGGGSLFVPSITVTPSTIYPTYLISNGDTDSGTFPLIRMSARINNGTVTNRTLFDVANINDPVFSVRTDGISVDNTLTSGVAAIIENSGVANTNDIAQFHNSTGTVASITNDGYITAQAATGTSDTVAIWDGTTLKKKTLKNQTIFAANPYDNLAGSATQSGSLTGSSGFNSNSDVVWLPVPADGTLQNAYLVTRFDQPADGSLVATLIVDGSATSVVLTIPANTPSQTVISDLVNTASVSAGDLVRWEIVNNSASTSARIASIVVEFEYD